MEVIVFENCDFTFVVYTHAHKTTKYNAGWRTFSYLGYFGDRNRQTRWSTITLVLLLLLTFNNAKISVFPLFYSPNAPSKAQRASGHASIAVRRLQNAIFYPVLFNRNFWTKNVRFFFKHFWNKYLKTAL